MYVHKMIYKESSRVHTCRISINNFMYMVQDWIRFVMSNVSQHTLDMFIRIWIHLSRNVIPFIITCNAAIASHNLCNTN